MAAAASANASTAGVPVAVPPTLTGGASASKRRLMGPWAKGAMPFVCGGGAAMFASFCIHPIDLTKVRLQLIGEGVKGHVRPSALSVARDVVQHEGVRGLYSGLSASITRQATYGTARIGLHSQFSRMLRDPETHEITATRSFIASFASGAIGSFIGNPFDVSLVRMQSDGLKPAAQRRGYTGVFNAVIRITNEEGLRALWHGYTPTLVRAVAMNVGMMASYDQAKQTITHHNGPGLLTNLASSAIAGFCCAFLSLPADMVKTRLQNQHPDPVTGVKPLRNIVHAASTILRTEGVFAFWRGFFTFYARCAPHAMIILMVREQLFSSYEKVFGDRK